MQRTACFTLIVFMVLAQPCLAVVIHDESFDGDLSGAFGAPTVLNNVNGANTIIGQIGNNGNTGATDGTDADYFSFVIPAGGSLTSITVDSFAFSPNNPGSSFFAYVSAGFFTGQGNPDIDAFQLFNGSTTNLIASQLPLGPGTYSFWLQEISPNTVDYQLTFNQVPEPTSLLLALGAWGLVSLRRRQ